MPARKPPLRAVGENETAPRQMTVTEAAKRGTTRQLLVAMRDRIAIAVENKATPARDIGTLTKRLHDIVREIEAIDAREDQGGNGDEVTDGKFITSAI